MADIPGLDLNPILGSALTIGFDILQSFIGGGRPTVEATFEQGFKLMKSEVPLMRLLGLYTIAGGAAEKYISSAPDLETYYEPIRGYVTQALGLAADGALLNQTVELYNNRLDIQPWDAAYKAARASKLIPTPQRPTAAEFTHAYPQLHWPDWFDQTVAGTFTQVCTEAGGGGQGGGGQGGGGLTPSQLTQVLEQFCQSCLEPELAAPLMRLAHAIAGAVPRDQLGTHEHPDLLTLLGELANCVCGIESQLPAEFKSLVTAIRGGYLGPTIDRLGRAIASAIDHARADSREVWDVPQPIIDQLAKEGLISPDLAQLASGAPFAHLIPALKDEWRKFNHPPSPEEVAAALNDPAFGPRVAGVLKGKSLPPFKEVLKHTPSVLGEIAGAAVETTMDAAFVGTEIVFKPIIDKLLNLHKKELAPLANIKPGDEQGPAETLLVEAASLGTLAHWAAILAEMIYPSKHLGITQIAGLLSELGGFELLSRGILGPEIAALITTPHRYATNARARSVLPTGSTAATWFARRLIGEAKARELMGFDGLAREYEDAELEAAYRPAPAFLLAGSLGIQRGDPAPIKAAFRFGAMREQDIDPVLNSIRQRAINTQVNATLTQEIADYAKGWGSEDDLNQTFDDLDIIPEVRRMLTLRAAKMRLRTLQEEFRKELITAAKAKAISITELHDREIAMGLDAAYVDQDVGVVTLALEVESAKEAAREYQAYVRSERAIALREAMLAFRKGKLDATGLTAALLAIGFDAIQAASYLALAETMNLPSLARGKTLSDFAQTQAEQKADARAAIREYSKGVIDQAALRMRLAADGYSDPEIEAELAYLNA